MNTDGPGSTTGHPDIEQQRRRKRRHRPAVEGGDEPQLHSLAEIGTEALLYFMVVFSPWAFGTTQPWSMWVMNVAGYLVGLLWLIKVTARRLAGWQPERWVTRESALARWLARGLGAMTVIVLGYCVLSAVNARATLNPLNGGFDYHECVRWLPHSYDRTLTWGLFWNYLALALVFWAARDWLLTKTLEESLEPEEAPRHSVMPARLKRLLWVFSINGALVALEGFIQRVCGSNKLLWLVQPRINTTADLQFGPYAYRSNAAQLFNLIWPVALGFWWALHRSARRRRKSGNSHHLLLSCVGILLVSTMYSFSRGAVIVAVASLVVMGLVLAWQMRRLEVKTRVGIFCLFLAAVAFAGVLGWDTMASRFATTDKDLEAGRMASWKVALPLFEENKAFGTGPGTMSTVFQLAPGATLDNWYAQLHNDWLETLITFGIVGSVPVLLALLIVLSWWFLRSGIPGPRVLVYSLWVGLAGILVHATADFPLQIYSLLFLVVLYCAMLSSLARRH